MGYDNELLSTVRAMYSLIVDEFVNQERIDLRAFVSITKPLREKSISIDALRNLGYDSRDVIQDYLNDL